jgi:hypothetical protein
MDEKLLLYITLYLPLILSNIWMKNMAWSSISFGGDGKRVGGDEYNYLFGKLKIILT